MLIAHPSALLAAVVLALPAVAQEPATPPAAAPDPPAVVHLLREGTRLLNAEGRMVRDPATGWWTFLARTTGPEARVQELVLLPSRTLEQMQATLQSQRGEDVAFEVSGDVLVYRTRNFLLPTGSAQVLPSSPPPTPAERPEPLPADDDSVEAIMRQLAESVGPLQRRADPATAGSDASAPQAAAAEGGEIVWRRGRLRRSDDGAWLFVFDADAEGGGDPPVYVLPCLMLERMEQHLARSGRTAPLLLSGRTYRYGDRAYLLPSVFRVPRDRTVLVPE